MPLNSCAFGSKFCPGDEFRDKPRENEGWELEEEAKKAGVIKKDCNECVDTNLKNNEIPECFFSKVDEQSSADLVDRSVEAFAEKVMKLRVK